MIESAPAATGNTQLVAYGIEQDESDYHCHIDLENRMVVVFATQMGCETVRAGSYKPYDVRPPWANGVVTARGIRVPHDDIPGASCISIPGDIDTSIGDSTTSKARQAENVYRQMRGRGMFEFRPKQIMTTDRQHKGIDFVDVAVQVKADLGCYKRGVFLQTHECNPYSYH